MLAFIKQTQSKGIKSCAICFAKILFQAATSITNGQARERTCDRKMHYEEYFVNYELAEFYDSYFKAVYFQPFLESLRERKIIRGIYGPPTLIETEQFNSLN